jgi:truncated hemoglobin YjbI
LCFSRGRPRVQPRLPPQHVERLAAYWAEALGGPTTYSDSYSDETTVVRMHSGNGEHDEMDRRAIACFDQALADVGLAHDGPLRQVLHDYFAWATTTRCLATTSPRMTCRTASVSHTGRGTDLRCKGCRPLSPHLVFVIWLSLFESGSRDTLKAEACRDTIEPKVFR